MGFGRRCSLGRSAAFLFIMAVAFGAGAQGSTTQPLDWDLGGGLRAHLDAPVVVCTSEVGEKRWGRHQFAAISEYPGGRILLRHHAAEDAVKAYGTAQPTYISSDQGKTWQPFKDEGLPPSQMTYPLLDGHFQLIPMAKPFDATAAGLALPQPVATSRSYNEWSCYRVDQCPTPVQQFMKDYQAVRWTPQSSHWQQEQVTYDIKDALVWSPDPKSKTRLLSRTCFEHPPLRLGRELLFADYRSNFIQPDGSIPKKWAITCMVSQDNGKSWQRRSTIALDRQASDSLTEPMLAQNTKGELVCVIRRADHEQKPMCITYSADRGKTWEELTSLEKLGNFGVFPGLQSLECGVMVMSYGRPGIYLSFSTDGTGRNWSAPFCMLAGDAKAILKHTDAYTSMLSVGPNKLLLAYTDFQYIDPQGQQRKAVLVRTLTIVGAASK